MSVDLAIHLGVHKTATTLIQRALRSSEAGLESSNAVSFSAHASRVNEYQPFRAAFLGVVNGIVFSHYAGRDPKINSARLSETGELFRRLMAAHPARRVIISDENLLGIPAGHHYRKRGSFIADFYARSDLIASTLFEITREFSPRIRFYTRRQSTLIPSLYSNSVSSLLYGESIEKFVSELNLGSFRFDRIVDDFRARFSDVSVAAYEPIKVSGAKRFLEEFFDWAGCGNYLPERHDEVVNRSINDVEIDICHVLWKYGDIIAPRPDFMRWVRKMPGLEAPPSAKGRLSSELQQSLDRLFADDVSYRDITVATERGPGSLDGSPPDGPRASNEDRHGREVRVGVL